MKYRDYTITNNGKFDWKVTRSVSQVAKRDVVKNDEVVVEMGEKHTTEQFVGYYSDVGHALSGIVRHSAGENCEDIVELAAEFRAMLDDIRKVTVGVELSASQKIFFESDYNKSITDKP
jgi:hypothetical protein